MSVYVEERAEVFEDAGFEPLIGAMRTVITAMETAAEQGETGFHPDCG